MMLPSITHYRISPKASVDIGDHDPDSRAGLSGKVEARDRLIQMHRELRELQQVMYAEGKHSLLVVLQAMDTAGKDSTIRRVFGPLNPQGVGVVSFKAPTPTELAHDFLWRIHPHTPAKGMIQVFNRSHYEDVLIVKVHKWVSAKTIKQRYQHIRNFESLLTENGTAIVKIFLNISKEEQKLRLQERLDRPEKRWKFNPDDMKERALWSDYMEAYETAMAATSTREAPWYIIPANSKSSRDVIIASILIQTLRAMKCKYPPAEEGLEGIEIPD